MVDFSGHKNLVDVRGLQRIYAHTLTARARWERRSGKLLPPLVSLMRAWRVTGRQDPAPPWIRKAEQLIADACYERGALLPVRSNRLYQEYVSSPVARRIREQYAAYPPDYRVRMRYPRDNDDPERQGDLILLKPYDPETGEKGVILVSFTESVQRFAALFDVPALAERYALVFEPSSWGYQDWTFMLFLGSDLDVLVESPWAPDYEFIRGLEANLVPTRVGAGDWIDPDVFRPEAGGGVPEYDLVMVSSWHPLKRHELLFRTVGALRRTRGHALRLALIGYPSVWTRKRIEELARRHGVLDLCTIFESIPHEEVARVVSRSGAYVLLSRREGANRALYEALFCDTPVLVHHAHRGVNRDHVTPRTGVLFEDDALAEAIEEVLDPTASFEPREWALQNTGYHNATRLLERDLRAMSEARGLPWSGGIAEKKMAPALRYARSGVYRDFDEEYRRLAAFLRDV